MSEALSPPDSTSGLEGALQTSDVSSPLPLSDGSRAQQARRHAHSPGDVSSPGLPLFSSPPANFPTSEVDASSPLNFGTPSSRLGATPSGFSQGTPMRHRSDLGGGSHRLRQVNFTGSDAMVSRESK